MAVRQTISSLLERTVTGVRSALHDEVDPSIARLEARIEGVETTLADRLNGLDERLRALEAADGQLEKRLSMAMGAIQAATAQLMQLREAVAQVQNQSQQAMQRATSALSTAETAAEGVGAVEAQLEEKSA